MIRNEVKVGELIMSVKNHGFEFPRRLEPPCVKACDVHIQCSFELKISVWLGVDMIED